MSEYQFLTSEIRVPREWPVEVGRSSITHIVHHGITRHRLGQRVVVTIGKTSALITNVETRPEYVLERTDETNDEEIYNIIVILPVKTMMVPLKSCNRPEAESVQLLPTNIKSNHPISRLFMTKADRLKFMIIEPNIEKILQLKGIRGPDRYNHVLITNYRVPKIKLLEDIILPQKVDDFTSEAGSSISVEQVPDDEWDIMCFDRLPPPQPFWRNRKVWKAACTWIFDAVILVLIVLFIYVLVLISQYH